MMQFDQLIARKQPILPAIYQPIGWVGRAEKLRCIYREVIDGINETNQR